MNYPWFLNTYDGYRFPVQRVDSLRYFLMLHFGGIYLDLDNVRLVLGLIFMLEVAVGTFVTTYRRVS